jgi:ABC-2 type transport system permease protein
MFLIGFIFFNIRSFSLPAILLVSITLSLSANGLGLLVAAVTKTEAQINGLSILLAIALGALGGMMVPGFLMPGFMRSLSMFTPHAWALRGYHDIILRGMGLEGVCFESGVLILFALLFFLIALWRFRFHEAN